MCVRAAARKYALQQEETAIIVQKAEQDCQRQLTELQEQGRADGAGLAPGIRNLGHEVEQFVNKSTAATRVSAFAEVGMVRDPPIRTP